MRMVRIVGALAIPLFLSCGSKRPTTVVVALSSEAPLPKSIDSIRVTVQVVGTVKLDETLPVPTPTNLPGTLVIERSDGDEGGPVTVIVRGFRGGTEKTLRRATLPFADGKQKLLRMPIQFACFDAGCAEGQTCKAGACVDDTADVEALPDFAPEEVFPTAGKCFDRQKCVDPTAHEVPIDQFLAKVAADPTYFDREGCSIAADPSAQEADLNMGLFWAEHPAADWTVVDFDADEGWQFADAAHTRIKLAPGLCAILRDPVKVKRVTKLLTASGCPPKPPTVPECPEVPDDGGQP